VTPPPNKNVQVTVNFINRRSKPVVEESLDKLSDISDGEVSESEDKK